MTKSNLSSLRDLQCSNHFKLSDLIDCGPTQKEIRLANLPAQPETIEAICNLSNHILDHIVNKFGQIEVTFGFCSHELAKEIKKRPNPHIAPELDQHSSHEINSKGTRICKRDGFAIDFKIEGRKSSEIAIWINENLEFDRIYFYGDERPLHVSYAQDPVKQITDMRPVNGRRVPKIVKDPSLLLVGK